MASPVSNLADRPPDVGALRAWIAAIRPTTLWAGAVPVLVGTALAFAAGRGAWTPACVALLGALLIQIGTNLVNDWADARSGADGPDRLGPPRATALGWLRPRQVVTGAAVALCCATLCGVYLVYVGGWPILVLGVASLACAVGYTAGPFPLGYHGLGDLFVFLFFGVAAVCGTYFLQAGTVALEPLLASVAIGALATAILVVNNLRDRVADARAAKRTLAVRFGARFTRVEHTFLLATAYGACVAAGWWWPLASLPLAGAVTHGVWTREGIALNRFLGATARLELVFGLLIALNVLWPGGSP